MAAACWLIVARLGQNDPLLYTMLFQMLYLESAAPAADFCGTFAIGQQLPVRPPDRITRLKGRKRLNHLRKTSLAGY